MESYFVFIFMSVVLLIAIAIGIVIKWDKRPIPARYGYDANAIQAEILADKTLGDEERAVVEEVAVLELPRRHLVC
ncbi:MAG: hypothetical protein VW169_03900 [Rhodospirillaceae bacterium]